MYQFTLDAASEFLFRNCIESLSGGLPYPHNATNLPPTTAKEDAANDFIYAFSTAQEVIFLWECYG
jgi:hypothetical protein